MVGAPTPQTTKLSSSSGILQLEDIPILCQPYCRIKDPKNVMKIINEFIGGGPKQMQVVTDFDFTITKQRTDDGTVVPSSFGIFDACKSLPEWFVAKSRELHDIYRPIEVDPLIPLDVKTQAMIEWWTKSGDILVGFAFDLNEINEIAAKYAHAVRDHAHDMFQMLKEHDIPVLVFSAGLGHSVVAMLEQANLLYPNVKVISNFLKFDENGQLNGFQEPIIHTFNKNETMLEGSEYYDLVHNRDHIILMGDTLADAGMASGVPASSHVLKIGFLFHHVEESLEKYMDTFDIVLIDDQTMDVANTILSLIVGNKPPTDAVVNSTDD